MDNIYDYIIQYDYNVSKPRTPKAFTHTKDCGWVFRKDVADVSKSCRYISIHESVTVTAECATEHVLKDTLHELFDD